MSPVAGYTPIPDGTPISPATGLLQARAADATVPPAFRNAARRRGGGCFLLAVCTVILIIYSVYFVFLQVPLIHTIRTTTSYQTQHWAPLLLVISFHSWFALFTIALIQCSTTDPGRVPSHWGFYVGEESKRRRYCRVCNVWKPDRTHHCSSCGRCVLNMDHHCPWINNCVGFFNRKFFIQMLWYGIISLIYICAHGTFYLGVTASNLWPTDYRPVYSLYSPIDYIGYTLILIVTLFSTILLGALFPFTKFHMGLVVHNSTTIESMDVTTRDISKYDLGPRRNIEQVFGSAPYLWWIPFHLPQSRPVGDGIRWRRHYLRAIDEEDA